MRPSTSVSPATPPTKRRGLDFTAFDREAVKWLDQYRFTTFALPLRGMGGGTFQNRSLGELEGFKEGTPEHARLFKDYLGQVETHLRQHGWLGQGLYLLVRRTGPQGFRVCGRGHEAHPRRRPRHPAHVDQGTPPRTGGPRRNLVRSHPGMDAGKSPGPPRRRPGGVVVHLLRTHRPLSDRIHRSPGRRIAPLALAILAIRRPGNPHLGRRPIGPAAAPSRRPRSRTPGPTR